MNVYDDWWTYIYISWFHLCQNLFLIFFCVMKQITKFVSWFLETDTKSRFLRCLYETDYRIRFMFFINGVRKSFCKYCIFLYETDYAICFTTSRNGFWDPFCNLVLLFLRLILRSVSCIWKTDFDIRFVFFLIFYFILFQF